jgi:hypothetical protein
MGTPNMGRFAKLGMGTTSTVDKPLDFASESVGKIPTVFDANGIRGTRSQHTDRTREGIYTVSGSILFPAPAPKELDTLLYWTTGSAKSGNTFSLAETLQLFYLSVDRTLKVYTYDCIASRVAFRSSSGQPLSVQMDVEGMSETIANAGTFPSLTLETGAPFMFHDCVCTFGGTAKEIFDLEIVVDNMPALDRFVNTQKRSAIPTMGRVVSVLTRTPFTSDEIALITTSAVAVVATFTNGTVSCQFTMPAVRFTAKTPTVVGPDEIVIEHPGVARRTDGAAELTSVNDSTV